jgi:hypothetical protein
MVEDHPIAAHQVANPSLQRLQIKHEFHPGHVIEVGPRGCPRSGPVVG